MVKNLFTVVTLAFLFGSISLLPIHAQTSSNYELSGGWWFDGNRFVRQKLYVVNGVFQKQRPAHIDEIIKLDDLYIVPPFGDAHSHAYADPKSIAEVVQSNLRDGVFYGGAKRCRVSKVFLCAVAPLREIFRECIKISPPDRPS
jgi:hypothetical protein